MLIIINIWFHVSNLKNFKKKVTVKLKKCKEANGGSENFIFQSEKATRQLEEKKYKSVYLFYRNIINKYNLPRRGESIEFSDSKPRFAA